MRIKLTLILAVLLGVFTLNVNADIKITVDGKELKIKEKVIIENSRSLVPLRGVFEALGAELEYDKDGKFAVVKKDNAEIMLSNNEKFAYINGTLQKNDVASKIVNARFRVPLRLVAESIGAEVSWNGKKRLISIKSPKTKKPKISKENFKKFESKEEFLSFIDYYKKTQGSKVNFSNGEIMSDMIAESEQSKSVVSSKDSSSKKSSSKTNSQVDGVYESDIVVNTDKLIARETEGKLVLLKVENGNFEKIFEKEIGKTRNQLFLSNENLVVINEELNSKVINPEDSSSKFAKKLLRFEGQSIVKVYDIDLDKKDKNEMVKLKHSFGFTGEFLNTRLIGNRLYLLTSERLDHFGSSKKEYPLPSYENKLTKEVFNTDYKDISYLPKAPQANFLNFASLDIKSGNVNFETVIADYGNLYMSKNAMYIAYPYFSYMTGARDKAFVPRFFMNETAIVKFDIEDGKFNYKASALINGRILNQFSMDEYKGNFRIATTSTNESTKDINANTSNNVFIYDENLKKISSVEGLAKGERIYSSRFNGDFIYLVTFKEVDPLFVIDAKDAKNPKVLGELKIPGFSSYMHMIGNDFILGFGKQIDEKDPNSENNGIKLSLFDVRDKKNPKELKSEVIGKTGSYTPLEYEHRSLMFLEDEKTFAFPVNISSKTPHSIDTTGFYVYDITEDNFKYRGSILSEKDKNHNINYLSNIDRVVYIDGYLYAVSKNSIVSHKKETMKKVSEFKF